MIDIKPNDLPASVFHIAGYIDNIRASIDTSALLLINKARNYPPAFDYHLYIAAEDAVRALFYNAHKNGVNASSITVYDRAELAIYIQHLLMRKIREATSLRTEKA